MKIRVNPFFIGCLGLTFIIAGVRGSDLGSLEHWKYWLSITMGSILISVSYMSKLFLKQETKRRR